MLLKEGYFTSIDWWSLGVIVFEMATGRVTLTKTRGHSKQRRMTESSKRLQKKKFLLIPWGNYQKICTSLSLRSWLEIPRND